VKAGLGNNKIGINRVNVAFHFPAAVIDSTSFHGTGWSGGNGVDWYSGGARVESRPRHRLS
jgi:hypothetical protein